MSHVNVNRTMLVAVEDVLFKSRKIGRDAVAFLGLIASLAELALRLIFRSVSCAEQQNHAGGFAEFSASDLADPFSGLSLN